MTVRAEHESLDGYLARTLTPDEAQHVALISFNQWTFALGAVIETALAAQSLGSQVTVALWADRTPLRDPGWRVSQRVARLLGTRTRDQNAERALLDHGVPVTWFAKPPLRRWRPVEPIALPGRLTRSEVRRLQYRGSDMGRSILQVHPDGDTPIRDSYEWPRRYLDLATCSYAWAFDQAYELMRRRGVTTVVVYNGRFTHDRAVAAAAAQLGVRVLYYDNGGYDTAFDLTSATTHDWAHLQVRMREMYDTWDPTERDELGASWFLSRRSHTDANNAMFTGVQERGHVPDLPTAERIVVYFSSSGDEIVELGLDWDQYFHSQERALHLLADECRRRPGTALIVRTHPHMRLKPADDLADWEAAVAEAAPDLHIGPSSTVDSYALMERADVVFTYGSTTGVEAAFCGRPVVVMGPSAYDRLGCARRISRAEEIGAGIDDPPAPNPQAALPYGLMMQRRGFSFACIEGRGEEASLGGVDLAEANDLARKVSEALQSRQIRRLTRR